MIIVKGKNASSTTTCWSSVALVSCSNGSPTNQNAINHTDNDQPRLCNLFTKFTLIQHFIQCQGFRIERHKKDSHDEFHSNQLRSYFRNEVPVHQEYVSVFAFLLKRNMVQLQMMNFICKQELHIYHMLPIYITLFLKEYQFQWPLHGKSSTIFFELLKLIVVH